MRVESGARGESAWARAARLEAALWVVSLFWAALVLAMAGLTQVSGLALLVVSPVAVAGGLSLGLRLREACVRHRGDRS
jgi:hypothetical protein